MEIEQVLITWIHLTAAAIWVGGSLFIGIILAPVLKTIPNLSTSNLQIMMKIGRRFNKIALPALLTLIITGLYKAYPIMININILLSTSYGKLLLVKMLLVVILITSFIIHIKIINNNLENRIIHKQITEKQIKQIRKKIIFLGKFMVLVSIAIFLIAALLDSGI